MGSWPRTFMVPGFICTFFFLTPEHPYIKESTAAISPAFLVCAKPGVNRAVAEHGT